MGAECLAVNTMTPSTCKMAKCEPKQIGNNLFHIGLHLSNLEDSCGYMSSTPCSGPYLSMEEPPFTSEPKEVSALR